MTKNETSQSPAYTSKSQVRNKAKVTRKQREHLSRIAKERWRLWRLNKKANASKNNKTRGSIRRSNKSNNDNQLAALYYLKGRIDEQINNFASQTNISKQFVTRWLVQQMDS